MVKSREKRLKELPLTYNQNHQRKQEVISTKGIPKGCLAIKVGQGEEQQRIVVPVLYLNHPLIVQLLKEAEEEYGFAHQGTIILPCPVQEFRYVQQIIDREKSLQHHHHLAACFRV